MKFCKIDTDFMDYLKKLEQRIPDYNYGGKYKPFLIGLFSVGDLTYVTQLISPKSRHEYLKEGLDFKKIYNSTGKLIACINLNYMFPVKTGNVRVLNINDISTLRLDLTPEYQFKYANFFAYELKLINKKNIPEEAKKLYDRKYDFPNDTISKRCIDFKQLEYYVECYDFAIRNNIEVDEKLFEVVKLSKDIEDFKKNYQ